MDRLTERFSNGQAAVAGCGSNCKYDYKYCGEEMGACPTLSAVYEALARYEEAEEQGQIMRGVHMTNFEKYKNEILEITRETKAFPAIKDGAPVRCKDLPGCVGCEIEAGNCYVNLFEWLYEDNYKENIKLIAEYYSRSSRADLAIEEMAELQKALLKHRRIDRNEPMSARTKDIVEEITDVKIMLDQLIELYGCSDSVEKMIEYKIDRQLERIERKENRRGIV